jgi:hypothetical protein
MSQCSFYDKRFFRDTYVYETNVHEIGSLGIINLERYFRIHSWLRNVFCHLETDFRSQKMYTKVYTKVFATHLRRFYRVQQVAPVVALSTIAEPKLPHLRGVETPAKSRPLLLNIFQGECGGGTRF